MPGVIRTGKAALTPRTPPSRLDYPGTPATGSTTEYRSVDISLTDFMPDIIQQILQSQSIYPTPSWYWNSDEVTYYDVNTGQIGGAGAKWFVQYSVPTPGWSLYWQSSFSTTMSSQDPPQPAQLVDPLAFPTSFSLPDPNTTLPGLYWYDTSNFKQTYSDQQLDYGIRPLLDDVGRYSSQGIPYGIWGPDIDPQFTSWQGCSFVVDVTLDGPANSFQGQPPAGGTSWSNAGGPQTATFTLSGGSYSEYGLSGNDALGWPMDPCGRSLFIIYNSAAGSLDISSLTVTGTFRYAATVPGQPAKPGGRTKMPYGPAGEKARFDPRRQSFL